MGPSYTGPHFTCFERDNYFWKKLSLLYHLDLLSAWCSPITPERYFFPQAPIPGYICPCTGAGASL